MEAVHARIGREGDVAELASEVLGASRADPGQVPSSLRAALERIEDRGRRDALLDDLREAQLVQARLRRRATELEALFSTARELVRLQDVDAVLRRLVERAHELMGTDVTYLSEFEAGTEQLRVRYSEGTVTAGFRDLLVPAGFGLASMVAAAREPAWVARYDEMDDAPHSPQIDAAVKAEGLVSFLGVPLAVGDEVLGALFACNRFPHESSPDEILLLSAFADHAAAVLHSARVLAEAEAAKVRAEQAYQELEAHLKATELAGAVHEELTAVVISGGSVVDVVSTLSRRLDRRVLALDPQGRTLRIDDSRVGLPAASALSSAIMQSRLSGRVCEVDARGTGWLLVAIQGADRVRGAIIAEKRVGLPDDVARRTLERAAHIAALVSFQQDAVSAIRAERRARWLLEVIDRGGAAEHADAFGAAAPEHLTGCAVFEVGSSGAEAAVFAARAAAEEGVVAQRDRLLIVAWTAPDPLAATERMRRVLADALRAPEMRAVVCVRAMVPAQVAGAVERAVRDLELLPALGVSGAVVASDALAPYHALTPRDERTAHGFIDDMIGVILRWDARRGTRLFETLACYFDRGESRAAVASALHIHVNTVQQRLDRIRALRGEEMDDPEFRFRLEAAVRLERLRRSVASAVVDGSPPAGR